jgi:hypothetical protein
MSWLEEVANTTPVGDGAWLKDVAETTPVDMNYRGLFPGGLSAKGHEGSSHTPSRALRSTPEPVKPPSQPEMWSLSREEQARTESPLSMAQMEAEKSPIKVSKDPGDWIGAGIIKAKGGNWLSGNLEKVIKGLKRSEFPRADLTDPTLWKEAELAKGAEPVNKWVDRNLRRYLTNDMGTEGDPVRIYADKRSAEIGSAKKTADARLKKMEERIANAKSAGEDTTAAEVDLARRQRELADNYELDKKHVIHTPTQDIAAGSLDSIYEHRSRKGFSPEGVSNTEAGKNWEFNSDNAVDSYQAGRLNSGKFSAVYLKENPWLTKLQYNDTVHNIASPNAAGHQNLGLQHLVEELHNAVNPDSGLPKELALRPESLERMGMAQAVEHVAKINRWREAGSIGKEFKHRLEMPAVLEDPKSGHRLVQLKNPGDFRAEGDAMGHSAGGYEPWQGHPDFTSKEVNGGSGYQDYGHGGWEAIKNGDAQVISLIDHRGGPHATVEQGKEDAWDVIDRLYATDTAYQDLVKNKLNGRTPGQVPSKELWPIVKKDFGEVAEPQYRVSQIKGKGNGAVSEKYWPVLQKFVKEIVGQANVDDLGNIGMIDLGEMAKNASSGAISISRDLASLIPAKLSNKRLVEEIRKAYPQDRYITKEELKAVLEKLK